MKTTLALLAFLVAVSFAVADTGINNGPMDGTPADHSEGKGLLVTPPGWTPVNVNTDRGDRLSVEASDRPGGGSCLRIKTLGSDAGVYQTIAPLEPGKSYLVSAWVKRLSGTLAIEAYSHAWGPAITRLVDGSSTGWTRLAVGLTPVDGGAHLYLVAWPEADFLIDDVQIRPASVQVGLPQVLPYDFGSRWRYQVNVKPLPGDEAAPSEVLVQAVSDTIPGQTFGLPQRLSLKAAGPAVVEISVPVRVEGSFAVQVTDPATGDVLGSSPVSTLAGYPWVFRYPHKNALFSSLDYQWPLRLSVLNADPKRVAVLKTTASIVDGQGKTVRQIPGRWSKDAILIPLDGRKLPPADYRLQVTVRESGGRQLVQVNRPLRVLAPAKTEIVCDPAGDTLINGQRFFPIGLYWVLANPEGWKPGPGRKTQDLVELREAGFNTLHTYAFEHNDAPDTDDNALAYLDMAQELGFRVMLGLRRDWYQGPELNSAAIEQRVRRLREHPALLCWTLWDEPDSSVANVPRVQAVYDLVNALDPYHPAMPIFMSAGGRPFREATDINFFDCYPGAGNAGILPALMTRVRAAIPDKPLWYVAQAYQQGDKLPSLEDMRLYWQHALDAEAKAIFWYSYGGDAKGWDSIRITDAHYANVRQAVRELADKVAPR